MFRAAFKRPFTKKVIQMALALKDVKDFIVIDTDLTDDDNMLNSMIAAAKQYIARQTGKAYVDDDEVWNLAIKFMVKHWYDHRDINPDKPGTLAEYPHSVTSLIYHIQMCSLYKEVAP